MRIDGGYILLSRKIDDSEAMRLPPATREIWLYILRKVNHCDYKNLKRGENIFTYKKIQDDLCWYAGYRKMIYSKNDIAKSIRRLHERNMIETTKATRGVVIKVVKYNIYQDPNNYEGHKGNTTKVQRKTQGVSTIYKNVYKKNKNNIPKGMDVSIPVSEDNSFKEKTEYGNTDINKFIRGLNKYLTIKLPDDGKARRIAKNSLDLFTKQRKDGSVKEGREFLYDDKWENVKWFLAEYSEKRVKKGFSAQSWDTLYRNIKIWIANNGSLGNN